MVSYLLGVVPVHIVYSPPPSVNESLAPLIKVRMTCNLVIDFMYYICMIACIMIYNTILKCFTL